MKFKGTTVGGTVEILATNDYQAIPFTVTETSTVKAGQPMTLAGKKATYTAGQSGAVGTTTADGILLYDVNPAENPNGALIVDGIVDWKKCKANSGDTTDTATIKKALPNIIFRENIGVTAEDTD